MATVKRWAVVAEDNDVSEFRAIFADELEAEEFCDLLQPIYRIVPVMVEQSAIEEMKNGD